MRIGDIVEVRLRGTVVELFGETGIEVEFCDERGATLFSKGFTVEEAIPVECPWVHKMSLLPEEQVVARVLFG